MKALLLLLALASGARAQTPSDAQKKYDSRDYTGAATAYAKLAAQQPREAAWRYNLGNALFKAGRLGPAIASYQRAVDLAPRDADARFNLAFALKRAGEEFVPPGVPPTLFQMFQLFNNEELAGLHWLCCWAALLLGALWLLRPALRARVLPWSAGALVFWLGFGCWWGARRALEPAARGVIIQPTAEVRSGPGDGFSVSFTVPEGRRVEVLSEQGSWLEVGLAKEGAKGYLHAEAIEKL